jgi:hypothetical protein
MKSMPLSNSVLTGVGGSMSEGAYGNTYAPDKGLTGTTSTPGPAADPALDTQVTVGPISANSGKLAPLSGDASSPESAEVLPSHITPPGGPGRG